jgi:hypothetical protein
MENSMKRLSLTLLLFMATLVVSPSLLHADVAYLVPVVTQVQGAAQYRTSLIVTNESTVSTQLIYQLRYRSSVDGAFRGGAAFGNFPLGPLQSVYFDDVIQMMRDVRAVPDPDATAQIFGTLQVVMLGNGAFGTVIARTYSPTICGFVGTAYKGTPDTGAFTLVTSIRRDTLTMNTRVNLGFISRNTTGALTDVGISFFDGATGQLIGQYTLSSRIGHSLAEREVAQLNDVFSDPILTGYENRSIVVRATSLGRIQGYTVILDGTSNDGSFYTMTPSVEQ